MCYSEEVKAQVMAALLAGQSVCSVAKEYNIPKGTVSNWKNRFIADGVSTNGTQKSAIGELLIELITEQLRSAIIREQTIMRDATYLKRQDAAGLAVLHGTAIDKSVRLLEALSAPSEDE